jgi:hypothetical protein
MEWKEILRKLELNKQWDEAIEFMEDIIANNPNNMDAYIAMNYLLMNLLVEEEHGENFDHERYELLAKKYFDVSWSKYSENPEYLYYTGRTAVMSEWYFGVTGDEVTAMLDKALFLDPDNLIYQWLYYWPLSRTDPKNASVLAYIDKLLDKNSSIQKNLQEKGAVGEYILDLMTYWAKQVLANDPYL